MAQAATIPSEPSPGQFVSKRGKARSWERAIVYNPEKESLEIRKVRKIEKGEMNLKFPKQGRANVPLRVDSTTKYMSCRLPSQENFVNVFLDNKNSDACLVTTSAGEKEGNIFIGRLNLEKLGIRYQVSRLCGLLTTLYIVKHPEPST